MPQTSLPLRRKETTSCCTINRPLICCANLSPPWKRSSADAVSFGFIGPCWSTQPRSRKSGDYRQASTRSGSEMVKSTPLPALIDRTCVTCRRHVSVAKSEIWPGCPHYSDREFPQVHFHRSFYVGRWQPRKNLVTGVLKFLFQVSFPADVPTIGFSVTENWFRFVPFPMPAVKDVNTNRAPIAFPARCGRFRLL
jgi:hypothetical protein